MGKKPIPIENKLILVISKHGGSATLTQIRHGFSGRLTCPLLEHARAVLGDLIVAEKSRSKGSKRPTTRLSLSLRGCAAVQFLRPGWHPQRLAVDVLKAWLTELQAERHPWSLQFTADAHDAYLWRQHEARRKEAARAAEAKRAAREKPAPKYPSAGRNRSPEDIAARRAWAATKWPQKDESVEESEIRRENGILDPMPPISTPNPTRIIPGGFCERCRMNTEYCRCQNPIPGRSFVDTPYYRPATGVQPTAQDSPSDSGLAEKIRKAGATVKNGRVQYSDRWITPEEWMQKEGWRLH